MAVDRFGVRKKMLGQILKEMKVIHEGQVQEALMAQKTEGGQIGQCLIRLGHITESQLMLALGKQSGMEVIDPEADTPEGCARTAATIDHDFVFCHVKATDSRGEDGDFAAKVAAIEEGDAALGHLVEHGGFDVICVSGDHSTPANLAAHSWHPVPFLLHGEHVRRDGSERYTETEAARGGLGRIPGRALMALMLGHAGRLAKFGA